jgi:Co/Zn/Cd efflux system component
LRLQNPQQIAGKPIAVVAGVVVYTGWFWLDTVVSLGIAVAIFSSTWDLLKNSVILSLDGVPRGIDLAEVKAKIKHELEHLNISHATLELEADAEKCEPGVHGDFVADH